MEGGLVAGVVCHKAAPLKTEGLEDDFHIGDGSNPIIVIFGGIAIHSPAITWGPRVLTHRPLEIVMCWSSFLLVYDLIMIS